MAADNSSLRQRAGPETSLGLVWIATLVVLPLVLVTASVQWPLDDFAEYWAAGRLNAAGRNPYDATAMLSEQRQIGWQGSEPVLMYNPPWTLAIAMPMGAVPFAIARSIWLSVQIVMILWCAARLWMLYGGAPSHVIRACGLALLWAPTLISLRMGQLSPVILLGLVGFLWSVSRRMEFAAGAFLGLTAVKPQLVALVWVPFLLWVIGDRRWRILSGTIFCLGSASLIALSTNPRVFTQYQQFMAFAPPTLAFESPNIATFLRVVVPDSGNWLQFLPACVGAAAVAVLWHRRRAAWQWPRQLPGLVLLSTLLTPYGGWAFDLVILLVPIIATATMIVSCGHKTLVALATMIFLLLSSAAFVMHIARVSQSAFIWMTPAVAVSVWTLARFVARETDATYRPLA